MSRALLALGILLVLSRCGPDAGRTRSAQAVSDRSFSSLDQRPLIKLGLLTRESEPSSPSVYRSFLAYLTERTPFRFQTTVAGSPVQLLNMLEERIVDVAELDHLTYLAAHRRFDAVPLARPLDSGGRPLSRCIFVSSSPGVARLSDLRGRSLALGEVHAFVRHVLPLFELDQADLVSPPEKSSAVSLVPLDGDRAVLEAVRQGRFFAGAVDAETPGARDDDPTLHPFHTCRPLPSPPWTVRSDLPDSVVTPLRRALLQLSAEQSEARDTWPSSVRHGFETADDSDYDEVRFITREQERRCAAGCHQSGSVFSGGPS